MGRQKLNNHAQIGQIRDNMVDLVGGKDPSGNALFLQRLGLAKKYKAETEGQRLENVLTGHKGSAIDQGLSNEELMKTPLMYSMLANTGDAKGLMEASEIMQLLPDKKNLQKNDVMASNMLLNIGGREVQPDAEQLLLNEVNNLFPGSTENPNSITPWTEDDRMRAFAHRSDKAPGADSVFSVLAQDKLRKTKPIYTAADVAKAEQYRALTPEMVLTEKAKKLPDIALANQRNSMTPHMVGKSLAEKTEILARVDETIHSMDLAEAESMQTQQKLISEGNLAEAKKQKTIVEMNSGKKLAAQELLELQAKTSLHWVGVEKVIDDIANNQFESALEGLRIIEETNTEKLAGQVESQEILRVKELVNNLKSTGIQQQAEHKLRVKKEQRLIDKTSAEITTEQTLLPRNVAKINQQTATSAAGEQSKIAETMLFDSKDQGQRIENYNLLKFGEDGSPSKTSSSKSSENSYTKELGKSSGKLEEPLKIVDPDSGEESTFQPLHRQRLAKAKSKGGEKGAFDYLYSLGKTPKEQFLIMAKQFNWSEDKLEGMLGSLSK